MSNTCSGCLQALPKNEFLQCSNCKNNYDLECANVSSQRFYNTLTSEHRKKWECQLCICKKPKTDNKNTPIRAHASTDEQPNITLRNKRQIGCIHDDTTNSDTDSSVLGDTLNNESQNGKLNESEPKLQITLSQLENLLEKKLYNNNQALLHELKNSILTEFTKTVADLKLELKQNTECLLTEQKTIKENVEKLNLKINNLEEEKNELKIEIKKILESKGYEAWASTPKKSLIADENVRKIVLFGLVENHHENEHELLVRISHAFYDILGIDANPYIETAIRIGKQGYRRPIEIELLSKRFAKYVLENSHCFRNSGLSVSEYLSGEILQHRNHLKRLLREARLKGKDAYIRGSKLYIEGKQYQNKNETNIFESQQNQNQQTSATCDHTADAANVSSGQRQNQHYITSDYNNDSFKTQTFRRSFSKIL